jgi:hypothetical protein
LVRRRYCGARAEKATYTPPRRQLVRRRYCGARAEKATYTPPLFLGFSQN